MNIAKLLIAASFALASLSVSAGPVSCNWTVLSAQKVSQGANVTLNCIATTGNVVATKVLKHRSPFTSNPTCHLNVTSGYQHSGSCLNPSFTTGSCNSGTFIGNVCESYYDANNNFDYAIEQVCGAGCGAYTVNNGYTDNCPPPGRWHQVDDPEASVYCQ